jgi:hypothetical protein
MCDRAREAADDAGVAGAQVDALDVAGEGAGVLTAGEEAADGVNVRAEGRDGGIADRPGEVGDDGEVAPVPGCPHRRLRADAVEAADEDHPPSRDGGGDIGAHGRHGRDHTAPARRREELLDDIVHAGRRATEDQDSSTEIRGGRAMGWV